MADLDTLAVVLGEAADIYLQSKSLDLAQAQFMQKQSNIEIDRQLQIERDDKEIAIRVLDSQMTRSQKEYSILYAQVDEAQADYQAQTGSLLKLDPAVKTSGAGEISKTMHDGALGQYGQELQNLNADIVQMRRTSNELSKRLSSIDIMRADIKGGAGGYAGGTEDTRYDPGDFSYEDYTKRAGIEGQPWLEKAYRDPTPVDITTLNTQLLAIDYKKAYIGARNNSDTNKATDLFLKGKYIQIHKGTKGFGTYRALLGTAGTFSAEGKEGDPAYRDVISKLNIEKERIVSYLDPVNYEKIQKAFASQGFTMQMIDQYSAGDTSFMKGWTAEQSKALAKQSERYKQFIDMTFEEGYNAVEKLQGAKGIMGTGEDLQKVVMKKISQYNSLLKTSPEKAAQLASSFRELTAIDISKQSDIEDLEMVVESEGFIGVRDSSLRSVITKSKDFPTFRGSTDFSLLKSSWLKADTYPDSYEYKQEVESLIGDLLPKWGRAEIMNEVGAW